MSAAPPGTPETVPAEAFQALGTMHQLTLESFLCHSREELIFRMLNRSTMVAYYGRAFLWSFNDGTPKALGVSGKAELNLRTPLMKNYTELVGQLMTVNTATVVDETLFPETRDTWQTLTEGENQGLSILWLPLLVDEKVVAALWLERWPGSPAWEEREIRLLSSLMVAYGAAWDKLVLRPSALQRLRQTITRSRVLAAAVLITLLLLVIQVQLRIVAPCEVIPNEPMVMAAPMDGKIGEILVKPGQTVSKGTPLFRYDEREVLAELKIAKQQVEVIRSDLNRAKVKAFQSEEARATILQLENKLKQEKMRLRLAEIKQEKLLVKAIGSGVVLVDEPHEWKGRPVTIGERILSVVDPAQTRLNIWLPEKDNIEFDHDNPVQVFLSVMPHSTLEAKLDYVSKHISQSREGVPSFRAEAEWLTTHDLNMKIGLTGSAMLYGDKVSMGYWLLRKPWASLRQNFGF
ncbi:MAG: efflux RND transporter periplasmic adaptor subunit [Planctomycetota bacterium]|jgi:multidrug resistance efflux pump